MPKHKLLRPVHFCNCGDHAWVVLTQGYVTLVSVEDASLLKEREWHTNHAARNKYYAYARIDQKSSGLHCRIIDAPEQVDHINGNGLDNRRRNLRPATNQQNNMNNSSHRDSSSRYKGVNWDSLNKKWLARIKAGGKQLNLGRFNNEEDAARAYDCAALRLFGSYAKPNFSYG